MGINQLILLIKSGHLYFNSKKCNENNNTIHIQLKLNKYLHQ